MATPHRFSALDPLHRRSPQLALLILGSALVVALVVLALLSLAGWL